MPGANEKLNRRRFLRVSGTGLAAGLVPPGLIGRGAGERIRVGIIGCGGRGGWVLGRLVKHRTEANVTVTALCDVWRPARERMATRVEKSFGTKPRLFARYQDLLALPDVDAVVITTPDFAHSPILTAVAEAGKDAYCEKPMATRIEDANQALLAVRKHRRVVQIGTQRRSDGRFIAASELLRSGLLGKVVEIDTAWHDNRPRWKRSFEDVKQDDLDWEAFLMGGPSRPFDPRRYRCWHLYRDYTVGTVGLLGSHLIDAATWLVGESYPTSATALGGTYLWKDREHADTMECLWEYPSGFLLRYGTRLGNSARGPELTIRGSRGSFDTSSFEARPEGGGKGRLEKGVKVAAKPGVDHVRNWLDCIRSREDPNAPIEAGHAHSVATIMAYQAWLSGRRQLWDAAERRLRSG
ncbi:MAG: Gfo/Idh/MocA family protein [Planctomycetota bacterium]